MAEDDLAGLEAWVAEARADEAVADRARRRRLAHQAEEAASFAGVLVDLAERGVAVSVHTQSGGVHHGPLVAVGHDFVALRARAGTTVLVAADAIVAVRAADVRAVPGDRGPGRARLLEELAELVAGGRLVRVVARGGQAFSGELRSVGDDVLALASDAASPELVYVPASSVSEVVLFGSG